MRRRSGIRGRRRSRAQSVAEYFSASPLVDRFPSATSFVPMAVATVRPAVPSDAAEIARIQLVTWRAAYHDLLSAEVLDALDADEAEVTWRHTIEQGPARV